LVLNFQAPYPAERAAKLLPTADAIMVMNEFQREHFTRMGARADRIWRCHWMVDWDAYAAKARSPEQRRYDAVYCSRLSRTKTPLAVAFMEALQELLPERPKMRALVVGYGRGLQTVEETAERVNAAAGRKVVEIKTGVFDTAQFFGDAQVVVGGHYVAIEGMAAGAHVIGAGYDGVFGLVSPENLEVGTEQSFGDHITPITGVIRDDATLVPRLRDSLRQAFENVAGWKDSPSPYARPVFRREDAIEVVEREFVKTARGTGSA
jgi:glycosyltransferase involved in cell wall biosynthesis